MNTKFIEHAGEINRSMPNYVVDLTVQALNRKMKSINGSKILIIGLAYKANVDDMRESPAFYLMDSLKSDGAELSYYDPHIPKIPSTRQHRNGQDSNPLAGKKKSYPNLIVLLLLQHMTRSFSLT